MDPSYIQSVNRINDRPINPIHPYTNIKLDTSSFYDEYTRDQVTEHKTNLPMDPTILGIYIGTHGLITTTLPLIPTISGVSIVKKILVQ